MGKIDLHIHTNKSDGLLNPKDVIDEAVKRGVKYISITDHDTINAYDEELFNYAKESGVILIPGVEISTKTDRCGIHVLGYNIDINNIEFKLCLNKIRESRHIYLKDVSKKLESLGYIINTVKLDKILSVTKAHIALDVISNELNKDLLIKNFGCIPSKGEFIESLLNEGCIAYVKKETITPKEAAKIIRSAGGKVVLAHPVAYTYEDDLKEENILNIINDMNADGIESNYIYVDRYDAIHDDCVKWNIFAKDNNLFTTIGSDFHNFDNLRPNIGLDNQINDIDINKMIKDLSN